MDLLYGVGPVGIKLTLNKSQFAIGTTEHENDN
jgi:hypothetical protein